VPDEATPTLISKADYARHRGVTGAMVSHWTNANRIVIVDGKVDRDASDRMLAASRDPARGGKKGKSDGSIPNTLQGSRAPGAEGGTAPGGASDSYAAVRTLREGYRAKTEEVEYRQRIGELVEKDAYDKALADALGPILAAFDTLAPRLAPKIAGESDARKVQNTIDAAVAAIRQSIADTLQQMIANALSDTQQTRQ